MESTPIPKQWPRQRLVVHLELAGRPMPPSEVLRFAVTSLFRKHPTAA